MGLHYFVQILPFFAFIIKIVSVRNIDTMLLLLSSNLLPDLLQVLV